MKLELKHLAPYLPYSLKFYVDMYEFTEGNCKPEMRLFTMGNDITMCLKYGKPILRPLSDLTKEIEHNGENFIPVDYFEIGDNDNDSLEYDSGNIRLIDALTTASKYNSFGDFNFYPFGAIQKLIEWHFDVFGLIDAGLAIDINTLNK